jgi:hypothetical protein
LGRVGRCRASVGGIFGRDFALPRIEVHHWVGHVGPFSSHWLVCNGGFIRSRRCGRFSIYQCWN